MLTKMYEFLKTAGGFPRVLLRLVNMDMPVRPGILVQRQSKDGEVASPLGEITEAEEDKHRQTLEPLTNAGETTLEVTYVLLSGVV